MQRFKLKPEFWPAGAVLLTALLWCLAVGLPVWETRSNESGQWGLIRGYVPALIGALGLLVKCPAWFANLLLIPLAFMLLKRRRAGFWLSLVALALVASAYGLHAVYGDNDEAVVVRRLVGFYLWLGSFFTIALAHALAAGATPRKALGARLALVGLMALAMVGLERRFAVGVSPLERTLKVPNDLTGFTAALAQRPPQADKDSALRWVFRQDLRAGQHAPSKRLTLLIAAGANPNQSDGSGRTLLMQALPPHGSEALVELFVRAGANVNARDYRGKSVLDIAQELHSSSQCQKFLVAAGARSSSQLKQ